MYLEYRKVKARHRIIISLFFCFYSLANFLQTWSFKWIIVGGRTKTALFFVSYRCLSPMIELAIFKKVRKSFFNSVHVDSIGTCENLLPHFLLFTLCAVPIIHVVAILTGIHTPTDKENWKQRDNLMKLFLHLIFAKLFPVKCIQTCSPSKKLLVKVQLLLFIVILINTVYCFRTKCQTKRNKYDYWLNRVAHC